MSGEPLAKIIEVNAPPPSHSSHKASFSLIHVNKDIGTRRELVPSINNLKITIMITIDFRKTYKNGELIIGVEKDGTVLPMLKQKDACIKDGWCYSIDTFTLRTDEIYTDEEVLESFHHDGILKDRDCWSY